MNQRRILKLLTAVFDPREPYTDDDLDIAECMKPRQLIYDTYNDEKISEDQRHAYEDELKEGGCPIRLDSIDGHEHVPTYMLHVGIHLYNQYQENQDIDYLYWASECGLYPAMIDYIDVLLTKIESNNLPTEERGRVLTELDDVLERFSRLYWMAGYIEASHAHYLLYLALKRQGHDDLSSTQAEKAMKDYVRAEVLNEEPHAEEISKVIYQHAPLEEANWNLTVAKTLFNNIYPDDTDRHRLQAEAISELRETAKDNREIKFRKL